MDFARIKTSITNFFESSRWIPWMVLTLVTAVAIVLLYPSLIISGANYRLGDVADRDIKAPRDFFIVDQAATENNRQKAAAAVLTVYDFDGELASRLTTRVKKAFDEQRALWEADLSARQTDTPPLPANSRKQTGASGTGSSG